MINDSEIARIAQQLAINNRQLIIDEIDRRWRLPSGVVSGGPYSSFSVNDQGLIIDAGAGGGAAPQYGQGSISSGTSYSSASFTLLSYSPTGFTSGKYTAPVDGKYHYSLYFRAGSAAWSAGDELRIYQDINGSSFIIDLFTIQAARTMYAQAHPHNIVSLSAGDQLAWYIYQTRSGGSITVDLTFVTILGFPN